MSHYLVVNVLKYEDGQLLYSSDGSHWDVVDKDTITASPKQGEGIVWLAGPGIKKIKKLRFDCETLEEDFEKKPKSGFKGKLWYGVIKENAIIGNEPKYDIVFKDEHNNKHTVDPKIKIQESGL